MLIQQDEIISVYYWHPIKRMWIESSRVKVRYHRDAYIVGLEYKFWQSKGICAALVKREGLNCPPRLK